MMARGAEEVEVPSELVPELSEGVRGRRPAAPGHDDREPLSQWSTAGTTLLGDACHPMLPFMAQGAAAAIEDAVVLSRCLRDADADAVPEALARYEEARRPRTSALQAGSRGNNFLRGRSLQAGAPSPASDEIYDYDAWNEPLNGGRTMQAAIPDARRAR
jgi:2-polyprenyl-6-methoxyphenol hydroxylase-like FAD-dependent oxidoreductase